MPCSELRAASSTLVVQRACVRQRRGVEAQDGVQSGTRLVVGRDAGQVQRGQPLGREHSGGECAVEVGDRSGREIDDPGRTLTRRSEPAERGSCEKRRSDRADRRFMAIA